VTKKAFALRRVTVTLLPDADLSKKMEAEEKAKIEAFRKSLTSEQVWPRHADCI
jgi:Zn-dependent M16 (insulinase) family peptidase